MDISQLKWECLHRLTQKNMLCIQKTAVYKVFSQPIEFKLGTQTFNQQTLCKHNILAVYSLDNNIHEFFTVCLGSGLFM